jgi:hypothetical protein
MPSSRRLSLQDNLIAMNQTLHENLYDTGDESSVATAPQSSSRSIKSSKSKSSGSSKAAEKHTSKKVKSSTETPEERAQRKKLKKEKKEKESKSKESKTITKTETPEEKEQRRKEKKEKKRKKAKKEKKKEKKEKSKDSKDRKGDKKKKQQQAADDDSCWSDDDSMSSSVMSGSYSIRQHQHQPMLSMSHDVSDDDCTDDDNSVFTHETEQISPKKQQSLLRLVKTLRRKVDEVESENRRLNESNSAMHHLEMQLNKAEEQLEYATEENNEFSDRVHALEEALLVQETELDNALATIRKQSRRERELLEAERRTDPLKAELPDEQFATREELAAVQEELEQLRRERNMAFDRASALSIESKKLTVEVSESHDRVDECKVVIEQLRDLWQKSLAKQSSASSVCSFSSLPQSIGFSTPGMAKQSSVSSLAGLPRSIGISNFFWGSNKDDDDKSVMTNDFDLDLTEDNTSVCSEDWEVKEMDSPERSQAVVLTV